MSDRAHGVPYPKATRGLHNSISLKWWVGGWVGGGSHHLLNDCKIILMLALDCTCMHAHASIAESLGVPVMVRSHITIDPDAMTRLNIFFLSQYWHNKTPCSRQGPIDAHAYHLHPNRDAAPQSATGVAPLLARPRGVVRPAAVNVCRTSSTTAGRRQSFSCSVSKDNSPPKLQSQRLP